MPYAASGFSAMRPDQDRERAQELRRRRNLDAGALEQIVVLQGIGGEADVDRRRDVVLVFDLGFGERGLVVDAPQGRSQALVELPRLGEVAKRFDDRRLKVGIDRAVWMLEVPEGPHTQERFPLDVQPMDRPFATAGAQFERVDLAKVELEVLERFEFDRQAVHVPTRDEVRILPVEEMKLDEDVLRDAVEKGPHVDLAVGIRRSVVEDPLRILLIARQAPFVDALRLPPFHAFRLALGQLRAHWKPSLRQIQRRAVIRPYRLIGRHRMSPVRPAATGLLTRDRGRVRAR
jgi:hypothetical protein